MHQGMTTTKELKDEDKKTTIVVHTGKFNKTTTLCLPTEEEWRQAISEDLYLCYIKRISYGMEETHIDPKEVSNKGY